jgi:hypothetical protein
MHTPVFTGRPRPFVATIFAAIALLAGAAQAQTWEYKSYKKTMGGQFNKDDFVLGTISIEEKDGKSSFRMNAGMVDACLRGEFPAAVVKTPETTTIEPQVLLSGCEKFRYVIRNDGSGGNREYWRNEQWVKNTWDFGLTPAK